MKVENYDVHLNAIRKALSHGNAAVMVGAGFSRNAQNGEQLATWSEISSELWSALNPDEPSPSAFSTSVVTQLGEQYARVFSKPALEEVLKRLIPDERVHPGSLHTQLSQCSDFARAIRPILLRISRRIHQRLSFRSSSTHLGLLNLRQ